MRPPLDGRIALVTGGSRGLGAATARRLAAWGARVIVTYREREGEAADVVRRCADLTHGARAEQVDLINEDSVRALFERVVERDGALDLLIANAAQTAFRPLLDIKMHQVDKTFAISVRHFLLMTQLAFPLLEPRGGRIVAVSGADTVGYIPGHGLLAAAKAGMEMMVRYLACELGPRGVTVVGVLPGYVETDSVRVMVGDELARQLADAERATHPLRTAATADDASEVVALVCLPEARWLNGQIIQNDGGGLFASLGRFGAWVAAAPPPA